ncbi:MAG: acetyl-CoA carboxylase biotin carboxyl carrier protein subunit [Dysgonamonadaceae bacterium]|nr:acetyl-CoA carboxylase biotin carboxyl carrier protein subunit [Dysgonamonadaceae bacterium]
MKNFEYTINGTIYKVAINRIEDAVAEVEVNGVPYQVEMKKPEKPAVTIQRLDPVSTPAPAARPRQGGAAGAVRSPLPGTIIDIFCKAGDAVSQGQKLLVLEAMKMENVINADRNGVIKEVKVNKGDSVLEGAELIIIE